MKCFLQIIEVWRLLSKAKQLWSLFAQRSACEGKAKAAPAPAPEPKAPAQKAETGGKRKSGPNIFLSLWSTTATTTATAPSSTRDSYHCACGGCREVQGWSGSSEEGGAELAELLGLTGGAQLQEAFCFLGWLNQSRSFWGMSATLWFVLSKRLKVGVHYGTGILSHSY